MRVRRYRWSSIEHTRRGAVLWCHPANGSGPAIRLTLESTAALRELHSSFTGILAVQTKRRKKEPKCPE